MFSKLRFFYYFLLLFFSVIYSTPLTVNAYPEEEFTKLVLKRKNSLSDDNPERDTVESLLKELKDPLLMRGNPSDQISVNLLNKLAIDSVAGQKSLRISAKAGHSYAQYLRALCLIHKGKLKKAMHFLCSSATQGNEKALQCLSTYAHNRNDPHALYEIGKIYIDRHEYLTAAHCLEQVCDNPAVSLNQILTQGLILQLKGNYFGALKYYRQAIKEERKDAIDFFDFIFNNPDTLLEALKQNAFINDENERVEKALANFAKSDPKFMDQIKALANENAVASFVLTSTLSEQRKKEKKPSILDIKWK